MPMSQIEPVPVCDPVPETAGFTLVEALCAVTILALGLVALFQALSAATQGSRRLVDRSDERILLRSLLDSPDPGTSFRAQQSGKWGHYVWRIDNRPAPAGLAAGGVHTPWQVRMLSYTVQGPGGILTLDRLKVEAAP